MATKNRSRGGAKRKTSTNKGRGSGTRKKGKPGATTFLRRWILCREAVGIVLLSLGLFFTAAFLSGGGAFLGNVGRIGVAYLLGAAGVLLAPLAMISGVLLLLGHLPGRRALGVGLILCAGAATLAAPLPDGLRFEYQFYTRGGGILGSGIYEAVYQVGGMVGIVIILALLYAAGVSLLTGVTLENILDSLRAFHRRAAQKLKDLRRRLAAGKPKAKPATEPARMARTENERGKPKDVAAGPTSGDPGGSEDMQDTREIEVVMPGPVEGTGFVGRREVVEGEYTPPSPELLKLGGGGPQHDAEETSRRLTQALDEFGVKAHVVRAVVGPRVTRYELSLGSGVKVGKVRNLQQDIAYALAATEVRILAPIPGKSAVGVEVPNTRPATVTLGDIFREYPDANDWALPVGLGKDISGRSVFFDLAEMPHLLVAGTTGSGKSVMLNSLLTSLLLTTDPRRVKMVLVDPKRVELAPFGHIPHLITPVVTDVKKAANALSWAVAEMERRYEVLENVGVRSLEGYNDQSETPMPYVVVVIDELADLMMAAAAKVEDAVIRLAQKARAVGIHLVVATQRPSVGVITGMIKANIPSRVAFAVSSQVDSRVILDTPGAEALLGMGDMLYKPVSASRPSRVQGAFISESEVGRVVSACRGEEDTKPSYVEEVTEPARDTEAAGEPEDELLPEAASFVVSTQQASVSAVQRRFRVGYSRAGRIIDALERKGIVGPYEGSKARSVSATEFELANIFGAEAEQPEQETAPPW